MRIRTIKPEFFKHDEIASLPPLARLLFIGLWCVADREGRLEDRPKRLKVEVLPYDDADIDTLLADLAGLGCISRYEANGQNIIEICSFSKHQRITGKEAETESKFPAPSSGTQRGNIGETPETTGREGKGKEGKENTPLPPSGELVSGSDAFTKTAAQRRAEKLFNRQETTALDASEKRAWLKNRFAIIGTSEADWLLLEWFYGLPASAETYRRRDLATLFNNWNAEITRARDYQGKNKPTVSGVRLV